MQFGSYRTDAETSFNYARSRYYSPTAGTWSRRDIAGYIDGANLQQYVRSNPTNRVDPTGLYEMEMHQEMSEKAAKEAGFTDEEAKIIGKCAAEPDNWYREAVQNSVWSFFTLGLMNLWPGHAEAYDLHFPGAGAPWVPFAPQKPVIEGSKDNASVKRRLEAARKSCDLCKLGEALHSLQDSYSHGGTDTKKDVFEPLLDKNGKVTRHLPNLSGHPKGRLLHGPSTEGTRSAGIEGAFDWSVKGGKKDPKDVDIPGNDPARFKAAQDDSRSSLFFYRLFCDCEKPKLESPMVYPAMSK